jgi:hypothetical protein
MAFSLYRRPAPERRTIMWFPALSTLRQLSSRRSASRRKTVPTRLALEELEARWCPCTVQQVGDRLTITGGAGADRIDIVDSGVFGVTVTCTSDGTPPATFQGVAHIVVNTGDGDDTVSATLLPFKDFKGNGGSGNDNFIIAILNDERSQGLSVMPTQVNLLGGGGDDNFNVSIGNSDPTGTPEVFPGAVTISLSGDDGADNGIVIVDGYSGTGTDQSLTLNFTGGAGDDVFSCTSDRVALNGPMAINMTGDDGNDQITARTDRTNIGAGAACRVSLDGGNGDDNGFDDANEFTGSYTLVETGGAGNDFLSASANDFTGAYTGSLDGGNGDDTIQARVGFNPQPDPPGEPLSRALQLTVDGSNGNDQIDVQVDAANQRLASASISCMGGRGDDDLTLAARGFEDANDLVARVDGGPGHDIAHVTSNVRVENVEELFYIDEAASGGTRSVDSTTISTAEQPSSSSVFTEAHTLDPMLPLAPKDNETRFEGTFYVIGLPHPYMHKPVGLDGGYLSVTPHGRTI